MGFLWEEDNDSDEKEDSWVFLGRQEANREVDAVEIFLTLNMMIISSREQCTVQYKQW